MPIRDEGLSEIRERNYWNQHAVMVMSQFRKLKIIKAVDFLIRKTQRHYGIMFLVVKLGRPGLR